MQLQVVVSDKPEANRSINMEVSSSLTPEIYDPELSDMLGLHDLVTYFAEAGATFVYPLSPESDVLIVSPLPLEHCERKEVYKKHLIEMARLMSEGPEHTPEDVLSALLFSNGEPLTEQEIQDIEMDLAETPATT